jgi:glycosyltransferase involved in cell wall biosynthesis
VTLRLALLTNVPAPYRVPMYAALAQTPGVDLLVAFDGPRRGALPALPFRAEWLGGGITLRSRYYQDETWFAERVERRVRFGYHALLRRFRPDAVVSGEFGWRSLHAAAHARLAHIPLFIWWEGTRFTERGVGPARVAVRRALSRCAAGLFGLGRGSVETLRDLGVPGSRIHLVPQAVDNAWLAREVDQWRAQREAIRAEFGLRGRVLLTPSRLLPHKGIAAYLEALRRLRARRPHAEFTAAIAGSGPEQARLRAAKAELGDALRPLGQVAYENLPRLLAAADVLVLPSLRDCWGMVVNEALAAGLPVLGSCYAGASADLLRTPELGRIFDPLDTADFDAALDAAAGVPCWAPGPDPARRAAVAGHAPGDAAAALLRAVRAGVER